MEGPNFELVVDLDEGSLERAREADEPPPKKARFATVPENQMRKLAADAVPAATKKTTKTWISVFEAYLKEKKISMNLQTVTAGDLADVLRQLYVEVRKQDGTSYQRPSLMGLRAAIQRQLRSPPYNRKDLNIITGADFHEANSMLDAYLKHLAKEGQLRPTEHKQPLTKQDLQLCLAHFYDKAESDPRVLTKAVWFFITYHFALRSQEVQENIKTAHLRFTTVGGMEVVKLAAEYRTKNHQGGLRSYDNSVSSGHVQDPRQVRLVRLLISKLHPDSEYLYMKARSDAKWTKDDDVWYTRCKLGHNLIARIMPGLSQELALSKRYTGHCLRATATQNLCNAFVPNQHIMKVTGHRSETSLKAYNSRTTDGQQVLMSALLDTPIDEGASARQLQPPLSGTQTAVLPSAEGAKAPETSTALVHLPSETQDRDEDREDDWDENTVEQVLKAMAEVDPIPAGPLAAYTGRGGVQSQKLQLSRLSTFAQGASFSGCTFNF